MTDPHTDALPGVCPTCGAPPDHPTDGIRSGGQPPASDDALDMTTITDADKQLAWDIWNAPIEQRAELAAAHRLAGVLAGREAMREGAAVLTDHTYRAVKRGTNHDILNRGRNNEAKNLGAAIRAIPLEPEL